VLDLIAERLASYRPRAAPDEARIRWAAVAVIVVPRPDAVLLIRRAELAGDPWSGHMAFPGGRHSPADPDLAAAAIRETFEEVGVVLPRDALLGTLDDIAPRTPALPPIAVRPFVFRLDARPDLTLNAEVAAAAWVPFETLRHPDTYGEVTLHLHGAEASVPAYRFEEAVVWGMTERILTGLLDLTG
jgi:8-oxo-dGTP pyrophosphatase MutT (NUDIX family)